MREDNQSFESLRKSGRWIRIARKWIKENGPASRYDYIQAVAPLMPTDIIRGNQNKKADRVTLAIEALKFLEIKSETVFLSEPVKAQEEKNHLHLSHGSTKMFRDLLASGSTVEAKNFRHIRNAAVFLYRLTKSGEAVRIAKGVYVNPTLKLETKEPAQ